MLEKSPQAQFLIPMAVYLAAGELFATVVMLILVPSLYLIMDDIRSAARRLVYGTRREDLHGTVTPNGRQLVAGD